MLDTGAVVGSAASDTQTRRSLSIFGTADYNAQVCLAHGVVMLFRMRVVILSVLVFSSLPIAGDKKKILLPAYVLQARTVLVLIDPSAGTSTTAPMANKTAQEDVEKALIKWGRFTPVLDTQTADLVITVRKGSGKIVQPTIGGLPTNDRPVIVQPTDTGIRVGVQQGHSTDAPQTSSQDTKPHPQTEVGPAEDMFTVYEGPSTDPWIGRLSGTMSTRTRCARPTYLLWRNSERSSKRLKNNKSASPNSSRLISQSPGRSPTMRTSASVSPRQKKRPMAVGVANVARIGAALRRNERQFQSTTSLSFLQRTCPCPTKIRPRNQEKDERSDLHSVGPMSPSLTRLPGPWEPHQLFVNAATAKV